jgi:hypothetical protein
VVATLGAILVVTSGTASPATVTGTVTRSLESITLAGTGQTVEGLGALAVTLGPIALAATGFGATREGPFVATLGGVTLVAGGRATVRGQLTGAITLPTLAADQSYYARLDRTIGPVTLAPGAGLRGIAGVVAGNMDAFTLAAVGVRETRGTVTADLGAFGRTITARHLFGTVAVTLDPPIATIAGRQRAGSFAGAIVVPAAEIRGSHLYGAVAAGLGFITGAGQGAHLYGRVAAGLGDLSLVAQALHYRATVAAAIGPVTLVATGAHFTGRVTAGLGALTLDAAAFHGTRGSLSGPITLPALDAAGEFLSDVFGEVRRPPLLVSIVLEADGTAGRTGSLVTSSGVFVLGAAGSPGVSGSLTGTLPWIAALADGGRGTEASLELVLRSLTLVAIGAVGVAATATASLRDPVALLVAAGVRGNDGSVSEPVWRDGFRAIFTSAHGQAGAVDAQIDPITANITSRFIIEGPVEATIPALRTIQRRDLAVVVDPILPALGETAVGEQTKGYVYVDGVHGVVATDRLKSFLNSPCVFNNLNH